MRVGTCRSQACRWGGLPGMWLHCIVPPQLWMGIPCICTGSLVLRWWCHLIYLAWLSMICGILTHMAINHHPCISWPWPNLWSLWLQREDVQCGGRGDNRKTREDKVPLRDNRSATHEKTVFKTWCGSVNVSSFLDLYACIQRSMLIHLERFIKIIYQLWRYLHTSWALSIQQSSCVRVFSWRSKSYSAMVVIAVV